MTAWRGVWGVWGTAVLLVLSTTAMAQDAEPGRIEPTRSRVTVPYNGPEIFARLIDHVGLKPLTSIDALDRDEVAARTAIIVFGSPEPLKQFRRDRGGIHSVQMRGASLLVASDRAFRFSMLEPRRWDVSIVESVQVHDFSNFQGERRCPLIGPSQRDRNHPLFQGLAGYLATNSPARFDVGDQHRPLRTLALLPLGTRQETDPPWLLSRTQPQVMLGTDADHLPRTLLIAGHGMFMNCMTIRDDLDNRHFALNVLRWLKGPHHTHALFIHEGKVWTEFKLPLLGPPNLPMPSVAAMNRVIDAIQKDGLLQRFVEQTIGGEAVVRATVVLATLAMLIYGLKKLFQSRHTSERTPLAVGVVEPSGTPLVAQQMREVVATDRFGEPAQALTRTWFREVAGLDPRAPRSGAAYELRAGFFARRRLGQQIESLWRLAREPVTASWPSARFLDLVRTLEELSEAVKNGVVAFPSTGVDPPRGS